MLPIVLNKPMTTSAPYSMEQVGGYKRITEVPFSAPLH